MNESVFSQGSQQDRPTNWTAIGVAGGAIAAGNVPIGKKRVWDYYAKGARTFEEYFFAQIPRTLQVSNVISQFESSAKSTRTLTPEILAKYSSGQLNYLSLLTNKNSEEIKREGLLFSNNKLFSLASNEELLPHASIIRNVNKSPRFSNAYARSMGFSLEDKTKLFEESLDFINDSGQTKSEIFQIIGGKTKAEHIKKQLFGYGTEMVERANRLAKSPFDFPVVGPILSKLPFRFGVKSGSGLQTLARLTGKLGIIGGAGVAAYKYADYQVRNTDLFNNTAFDQGLTAGFGNMWANINIGYSRLSESTGLSDYARRQEEIAPGSTSLQKLSAFPIMGAIAGAGLHYLERVRLIGKMQTRGKDVTAASKIASRALKIVHHQKILGNLGKRMMESKNSIIRSIGKSPIALMATIGAAIGSLPILPFIPGALGTKTSTDELKDIYSGKKEVAVRKSRWWEFGRNPYEGGAISYYRPHMVALLNQRGQEDSLWSPLEKEKGRELTPFEKFYTKNFTYDLERAHYYDRPYAQTGKAFFDVPIIGPFLSASLGEIVKPVKNMHDDEWMNGNGEYRQMSLGFGQEFAGDLGQTYPGDPISQHGLKSFIGEQTYRLTELSGLPGFLANTIKKSITGTQDLFDQQRMIESADTMYSSARNYWDMELGGMLGSNELYRRLLPHKRNQIDLYNPINNAMPDWLPGEGDRSPDFQHGDPYSKIVMGDIRLPGEGYASRFKELEGIDPADYPLIHKYKILADIAPFSDAFDKVQRQVTERRKYFNEDERRLYDETVQQLKDKKNKKTFDDYIYRNKEEGPAQAALTAYNESLKDPDLKPSWFESIMGKYWENMSHNAETPLEYLTPIAPAHKLLHMRNAVEDYAENQVFGTEAGFWDKPIDNFLRPFVNNTKHLLGSDTVPEHIQKQRKLEEYFDILKYLKATKLQREASSPEEWKETEELRRETLTGLNPYSYSYTQIFRSLPRRDRDYYTSFSEETDVNERKKILSMIPENEKGLFVAKWQQADMLAAKKAEKLGLLSEAEIEEVEANNQKLWEQKNNEGMPNSKELWQEYVSTKLKGENYADWYRRTKLIPQKLEEAGLSIPGPDWVGWNAAVDLQDIKLKLVENLGENIQDYDLWASQEKQLLQKPFINEEAIEPLMENNASPEDIRRSISGILSSYGLKDYHIDVAMLPGTKSSADVDIQENRESEIKYIRSRT